MGMEQNFKLAVKSLMSSKARAILTMLGIIIGVAAVIIITSLGNGMQTMMNEQFEKIGTNLVQVMVMGRGPGSPRTAEPEDMAELVTGIAEAHSFLDLEGSFSVTWKGTTSAYAFVSPGGDDGCDFQELGVTE